MNAICRNLTRISGVCLIVVMLAGFACYRVSSDIYYVEGHGYVVDYKQEILDSTDGVIDHDDRFAYVFATYEDAAGFIEYMHNLLREKAPRNDELDRGDGDGYGKHIAKYDNDSGSGFPFWKLTESRKVTGPVGNVAAAAVNRSLDSILQQPAAAEPQ